MREFEIAHEKRRKEILESICKAENDNLRNLDERIMKKTKAQKDEKNTILTKDVEKSDSKIHKGNDRKSKYELKEDKDNIIIKSKTIKKEQRWNTIDENTKIKFKKSRTIANKKSLKEDYKKKPTLEVIKEHSLEIT